MNPMPEVFVLGRAQKPMVSGSRLESLFGDLRAILDRVPGFLSATVWLGQTEPDSYLLFTHYSSPEAAREGLERIMESEFLADVSESFVSPIDIRRVLAAFQVGTKSSSLDLETYLSVSDRSADPGHGAELVTELQGICTELLAIPGCLGAIGGSVETLPEEVVSVAFWDSADAFAASLPKKVLYDVKLYRRVY